MKRERDTNGRKVIWSRSRARGSGTSYVKGSSGDKGMRRYRGPGKEPENTVAYQIASGACPAIRKKEILGIHMPMTKDKDRLKKSHADGARILEAYLDQGKAVAFLTLGDPTVYSTYIYLHNIVKEAGYETEIVSGVTSFCAAAARLEMDIASKAQQIHIIPASYQIEEALLLPGTKVLMKAGGKLPEVKEVLKHHPAEVTMVENCGMEQERIYYGAEQIPEDAGYYTLLFVKEEGEPL